MSSGVAGCTQITSKSVEGHMEAQVQLMKSQIDFLHEALAEVKEANRDLSQMLSNQQDKAMVSFEKIAGNLRVLCDRFEVKQVPSYAGMLQVSLPLFYGCHREYDTWEKSIENLFVLLNIEKESEKIALAIGCFRSNALNWWKLVSNIYSHYWFRNLDDWNDLRSALRERYAGTNTFDEAKVKLLNYRFHYGLDKCFKQHPKIRRQSRLYEAYYAALEVEREHDTSCGWNGPIEDRGIEVDDSRTNPLKEGGDDENHVAFHEGSPSEGNELVLHSRFGMPSLLCRPIKEERMDLDYLCDRELVQESYDQGDENVINFGVQTKGDEDLMEISAEEYQESLTLCAP
ncbi:OLC1v1013045C1 [Oldenlandia corymbosa var. corymbosa]|uniref:OLC1v1013045C1 n=1 Tax=Oldenlandia corymbosa var. corymbosa TaxID=529605 RepID=A0AAV1DY18_OLDCO|nr:OLC1v1013045C1 [Oldenlandia corymbosa var. corymbosa]